MTWVIIAHRLATVENADRIVVLDRGRIVKCGLHQQLCDNNGLYARLVHRGNEGGNPAPGGWMRLQPAWCAVLLLAASCAACSRSTGSRAPGEVVRVASVEMASEIVATGTVRPQVGAEVNVGPRISGVLRRLYVRVGDQVHRAQLLAELDHTNLDVAVRQAEAEQAEAEAQRELTADQLRRREALAHDGLISTDELNIAHSAAVLAAAGAERARAQLDAAQIERGYAEITAPIAGSITSIATREGETVAASFAVPTFLTIMDLGRLQVEAYVDEVDIGRVVVGQQARFGVDAFPQEEFAAVVQAIVPQARVRDNVVNYTVILAITGGKRERLRPDMTASVTITTGSHSAALVLPSRAIARDEDGRPYVLVREAGKQVRRAISIGEVRGDRVRVRTGLAEGDEVVVPGTEGGHQ